MCPYGDFFSAEVLPSIHAAAPCPEFIYTRFFSNPFPTIAFASFPLRDYCEKMPKNMKMVGCIGLTIVLLHVLKNLKVESTYLDSTYITYTSFTAIHISTKYT